MSEVSQGAVELTPLEKGMLALHELELQAAKDGKYGVAQHVQQARNYGVEMLEAHTNIKGEIEDKQDHVLNHFNHILSTYGDNADTARLENLTAPAVVPRSQNSEAKQEGWFASTASSLAERANIRKRAVFAGVAMAGVALATMVGALNANKGGSEAHAATNQESIASRAQAKHDNTVPEAVQDLQSNSDTIKANIRNIFTKQGRKRLNHYKGSMSNIDAVQNPTLFDYMETVAYSAHSSAGFRDFLYNVMHGDNESKSLRAGVSQAEASAAIEKLMTAKGTTFAMENPNKELLNHGQHGEHVFDSGLVEVNQPVPTITLPDGTKVYFKEFATGQGSDHCTNILTVPPHKTITRTITRPGKPSITVRINIPSHPQHPSRPQRPVTPQKPHHPPVHHPAPKHDSNTTPAGVPGEPRGSGGNGQEPSRPQAGNAPAGVGQEQTPLPAPVTTTEPTPTVPAETGTDPGTTGPAEQGNPGTTTPAGQINPGNTPTGD